MLQQCSRAAALPRLMRVARDAAKKTSSRRFHSRLPGRWDPWVDMERNIRTLEREMDRMWTRPVFSRLLAPSFNRSLEFPIHGADLSSDGMFRLNLDLSSYQPEDVKINLKNNVLRIEAKVEKKGDDGSRLYQEIAKQYTLPDNVDLEKLRSVFHEDGVLSIEAPQKPSEGGKDKFKEIPIGRDQEALK